MPFQGGRNLICSQKKYKVPPTLMVLSVGAEIEIKVGRNMKSRWKEIQNQVETNPSQRFPKFDGLSKSPSNFEDIFRHFVMNLSDFFWFHKYFSVHGRAHQSFPTSLVPNKSLYLASTFSASPHRGLRHSSQCQTARSK